MTPGPEQGFSLERMKGLEPSTFCMASTVNEQTATVLNRQTASLCGSGSGLSDYGCHQLTAKPGHEPRQPGRRRRRRGPLRPSRSSGKRSEARASTGAGPGPRFHGTPFARPLRTGGQFSQRGRAYRPGGDQRRGDLGLVTPAFRGCDGEGATARDPSVSP